MRAVHPSCVQAVGTDNRVRGTPTTCVVIYMDHAIMSVRLRLNLNLKVNPRVTLSNRNHNPTHCPQSLIVFRHIGSMPNPNALPIPNANAKP